MSDPFRSLTLALSVALPAPLPAQDAAAWRDSAQRLTVALQALGDSLLEGDSTVLEVARREDLVIRTTHELRGAAGLGLDRLVEVRRRWFGGFGATPSASGFRIVLRVPRPDGNLGVVVLAGLPDTGAAPRTERVTHRGQIADALVDTYGEMMYASLGPAIGKWLQLTPPLSMPERERRYLTMYTVATGTGRAQRGCVAGQLADCAYALGMSPPAIAEPGGAYVSFVRADLLLTALELGGPDAWTRLGEAPSDSIAWVLADAAGRSPDSLLARWRRDVLSFRPTGGPIRSTTVILGLGWIAMVFAGTLIGVRSRWL